MKLMKTIVALMMVGMATPAYAGDVVIDLIGVQAGSGDLYIGLQTKEEFLKEAGSYGAVIRAPRPGNHGTVIKDVAEGDYHIGVWHDINGDRKFSKDHRGIPRDGWSSYKAETLHAAPTWDAVKFTAPQGKAKLSLTMIYPR